MTSYMLGEDALERARRRPSYAGVLDPAAYGHTADNPLGGDPDQGDYGTLFEHLLKPAKYPKTSTYGGVLRSASRAQSGNPYQTMPDRGGAIDSTTWQYRPDRDPVEYQQMPDKGISQADLIRYAENLQGAVRDGKMDVGRARSVYQAAVAASQGQQAKPPPSAPNPDIQDPVWVRGKDDEHWEERSYAAAQPSQYQVLYDPKQAAPSPTPPQAPPAEQRGASPLSREELTQVGASLAASVRRGEMTLEQAQASIRQIAGVGQPQGGTPRTAREMYEQSQQRSAADTQVRAQRLADLKQRIATNRQARLDELNRRLAAAPSSIDPAKVGEGVSDNEAWARQEAQRLGIDPDMAVRVANTEGGFADPTRQNAQGAPAYGPYQLYVGGPDKPGLGDEALKRGIDPRNPAHAKAAITFALEHAKQNGWGAFQGAAKAGIGNFDGIGQAVSSTVTMAEQQKAVSQGKSVWEAGKLTPNQLTEGMAQGLDRETALAVCGPAAAIAFARKTGRNPTFGEALGLAKEVGWTVQAGMAGPASQVALLQKMGIPATLEEGAPDVAKVAATVQSGSPVTISSPGHYWVAERYDPKTQRFDFGESARVLKAAKGNSWFTLDEIARLGMGAPRAAIYMAANR